MARDVILILGGSGFIGQALTQRLASTSNVFVVSRTSVRHFEGIRYRQGSLDDESLLGEILPQCRAVIHLASTTTPAKSAQHPTLEIENIEASLRLLEYLRRAPLTNLIYFSSGGTVYGNPGHSPVAEKEPRNPLSFHGAGKVAIEAFIQAHRNQGGNACIIRPSNAYGPGQALKHGFGLIRTLLQHARERTTFEVLGDGETVRDFIYIDDLIDAVVGVIQHPDDSQTYNLGSGQSHSINHVKRIVEQVTGVRIPTRHLPSRSIDVRELILDSSLIANRLGWSPKVSLDEGIRRTWDWVVNQG